jgi:hypothetical protein
MSNFANFASLIQFISDGEPADANSVNRQTAALDQRTRYLWSLFQAAAAGQALFARQRPIDPSCVIGQAVYWDEDAGQFAAGVISATYNATTGQIEPAISCIVRGVVYQILASGVADILLYGFVQLDVSGAMAPGQTLAAGIYYLSASSPGNLTTVRSGVPITVLQADGQGGIFCAPGTIDAINNHTHLHFSLAPIPAGAHADPGSGVHVITAANTAVEGWLPASDPSFNSLAPEGAYFGYNMPANAGLTAAWPPLSADQAVLFQNGVLVDSHDTDGLVRVDNNGIWWMSNCNTRVPFPIHLVTTNTSCATAWAGLLTAPDACSATPTPTLDFYFCQPAYITADTAVGSLVSTDPRIEIFREGEPDVGASSGALQLALNLSFLLVDADPGGYLAIKSFDPTTQTFLQGPVATGIWSPSSRVTLTGDESDTVTIADVAQTVYRGNVGINVTSGSIQELMPDLIRIAGAEEVYYQNIMRLSLPAGKVTGLRVRFMVPTTIDLASPTLALNLRILGRSAGTTGSLTVTYLRIPAAPSAPATIPTMDSAVTMNTVITLDADQYQDVQATPVSITAGDDVLFMITRNASDGYAGEVDLLRISATLGGS